MRPFSTACVSRSCCCCLLWLATGGIECALLVGALYACVPRYRYYCCCTWVLCVGDSRQSALYTKALIHHILGPVRYGFEPQLEFPEREPQKILWFWIIWGQKPERNANFSPDSRNIFILEMTKRLPKLPNIKLNHRKKQNKHPPKKNRIIDRNIYATSSRPSISTAFNAHNTCENENKYKENLVLSLLATRYSKASYPPFALPLPTRLRFEHGHAFRPLCIKEVRWSGRCGMGTPFELVRHLADWGSTFARFGVALLPVRECKDRWGIHINIRQFLLAPIAHTAVLALELCAYWYV